jgi:transcriptional regulator with XRE-family HTH domain
MTDLNPNSVVGQNIRLLREELGLTQDALAQYLNIPREQVSYYENGSRSIPTAQLSKLAEFFCLKEFDFYESDLSKRKTNIAFAFRADALEPQDFTGIALFKKIVRNYLSMKENLCHE